MKSTKELTKIIWIIGLVFFLGDSSFSQAKKRSVSNPRAKSFSAREIAERFLPSVVLILCDDGEGRTSQGSGFFIRPDVIVTNYHVINGMIKGKARGVSGNLRGSEWPVYRVLFVDPQNDIALLSIIRNDDEKLPFIGLINTVPPRVGETIYALSNPRGLEGSLSKGMISSGIRKINGVSKIQFDAPISPGSSGGAILNQRGELIGMAQGSIKEGQSLNFAVPSSAITDSLRILDSRIKELNSVCSQVARHPNSWQLCQYQKSKEANPVTAGDVSNLLASYDQITERLRELVFANKFRFSNPDDFSATASIDFTGCQMKYITTTVSHRSGGVSEQSWTADLSYLKNSIVEVSPRIVKLQFAPFKVYYSHKRTYDDTETAQFRPDFELSLGDEKSTTEAASLVTTLATRCKGLNKPRLPTRSFSELAQSLQSFLEKHERFGHRILSYSNCKVRFLSSAQISPRILEELDLANLKYIGVYHFDPSSYATFSVNLNIKFVFGFHNSRDTDKFAEDFRELAEICIS